MTVIKQHRFSAAVIGDNEQLETIHLVAYVSNVGEHHDLGSLDTLPLFVPYESSLPEWATLMMDRDLLQTVDLPKPDRKNQEGRPCIVCGIEGWLNDTLYGQTSTEVLDASHVKPKPSITLSLDHTYNPKSTQLYNTLLAVNSEYNVRDLSLIVVGSLGSLTVHPVSVHIEDGSTLDVVLFCPSKYIDVDTVANVLPNTIKAVPYSGIRPNTEVGVLHTLMIAKNVMPDYSGMLYKDMLSVVS